MTEGHRARYCLVPNVWSNHLSLERNESWRGICSSRGGRQSSAFVQSGRGHLIHPLVCVGWLDSTHTGPGQPQLGFPKDLGALKDTEGSYLCCSGRKHGQCKRNWRHAAEQRACEDGKKERENATRNIEAMGCKPVVQPLWSKPAIAGLLCSAQPHLHPAEIWEKWPYIKSKTEHSSWLCIFPGIDKAQEINQTMHTVTDISSKGLRKRGFWL